MKKIFFILCACVFVYHASGQGTLKITPGANFTATGNAYLLLDNMHIVNDGLLQQAAGDGFVKLMGPLNVNLSGSGTTTFNQLLLAKNNPGQLNLQSNISVMSKVNFAGGLLNLNNSVLNLGGMGELTGESNISRAFTTGSGYIQVTGDLNHPNEENLGKLGAMITSTANMGATIIRRGHAVQNGVSGAENSIQRYYDIMPANNQNLKAMLRFFYFDAELNNIPEATLHQYKSNNNVNWDFVGADQSSTLENFVEKKSINKFERFTLATASAPTISCPGNITTNPTQKGCKALVSFAATATGIPAPQITYRIGNSVITSPHVFSKGATTVTATASNGVSPNDICSFTVTVECGNPNITSPVTNVLEETDKHNLLVSVLPNPSTGQFALVVKGSQSSPVTIKTMDISGRVIAIRHNVSANSTLYFGNDYLPGIYFVQAIQGKQHVILKIVKQ